MWRIADSAAQMRSEISNSRHSQMRRRSASLKTAEICCSVSKYSEGKINQETGLIIAIKQMLLTERNKAKR